MLHSVGLPICKKDDKKIHILVHDPNQTSSGGKGSSGNKKDDIVSKTSEQSQANGLKMNHGKNRLV